MLDPKRSAMRWSDTERKMRHFPLIIKERNTLNPLKLSLILERVPEAVAEETKNLFNKDGSEQMAPITVAQAKEILRSSSNYSLGIVASFLDYSPTAKEPQLLTHEILGRAFHKAYKQSYEVPLHDIAWCLFEAGRREKVNAIAQTFLKFEDPIAQEVAEAIFSERILFRLEDDKHYDRIIKKLPGGKPSEHATNAMYFAPGRLDTKPVMLVRMNPKLPHKDASREAVLFDIFGNIVHEFRHFKEFDVKRSDELGMMLLWETNAHLQEYHWRGKYGDIHYLKDFSDMGPAGFALTFRNMFEQWYPTWIRENRNLEEPGQ
jgi:hypothetical protein